MFSCKKNKEEILNLNNNKIDVLGHAGMGISSLYPINSAESLLACLHSGADGTELDVQLTMDNVLVAFHDASLSDKTNLSGIIRQHTWLELQDGNYNTIPYLTYKIVRISDFFDNYQNYPDNIFTFDIKLNPESTEDYYNYMDEFTNEIVALFSNYNLYTNCYIESQSSEFISILTIKNEQIKQFIYPQTFNEGLAIAQNLNLFGITINTEHINKEQVKTAHNLGFFITIWGVHSNNENQKAVSKFPDFIQTDKLDHLIKYLK